MCQWLMQLKDEKQDTSWLQKAKYHLYRNFYYIGLFYLKKKEKWYFDLTTILLYYYLGYWNMYLNIMCL